MVSIKNFFLKSLSVIFITIGLISLIISIGLSNSVNDLNLIKQKLQVYVANAMISQLELENSNTFDIKQVSAFCSKLDGSSIENQMIDVKDICNKVNNGEIADSQQLKKYVGQTGGKKIVDTATSTLYTQALTLQAAGFIFLIGFIVAYLLALILIFFVSMKIGQTLETFCYYNFILGLFFCLGVILVYLLIPNVADLVIKKIASQAAGLEQIQGLLGKISLDVVEVVKTIIIRPAFSLAGITIIGLIGWRTRFWIKDI